MGPETSTTSIDKVVDSVVSRIFNENDNDLPSADFCFTRRYAYKLINEHHLIKPNPFALAFGDLLSDLAENIEYYDVSFGNRIMDAVDYMNSFQRPIMPMVKKSLYCIYRERLQSGRNEIFPHVFGRIHRHQFNLLAENVLERGKVLNKRYVDLLQTKQQSTLTRFEQIDVQRAMEEAEARKSISCYSCLNPATYHCCEWRYYCSSDCQKKEANHFSSHPILFENPKVAVLDRRCLPKRVTRPQPKLDFPDFLGLDDPCSRNDCESDSSTSKSDSSMSDKENITDRKSFIKKV